MAVRLGWEGRDSMPAPRLPLYGVVYILLRGKDSGGHPAIAETNRRGPVGGNEWTASPCDGVTGDAAPGMRSRRVGSREASWRPSWESCGNGANEGRARAQEGAGRERAALWSLGEDGWSASARWWSSRERGRQEGRHMRTGKVRRGIRSTRRLVPEYS